MKNILITCSIFSFFVFTSCATLNREQCQTANWKDLGVRDGSYGYDSTRIASHTKACSEHGINPDVNAYNQGYKAGLRVYCTPEKGFEIGRTGSFSRATCPADLAPAFYAAVENGRRAYQAELAAREAERKEKERQQRNLAYFSPEPRGGLCDSSRATGICFVFSGTKYLNASEQMPNRMACNLLQGEFRPAGQCTPEGQLGRCTIAKGAPDEYMLYYYQNKNLDIRTAQQDCANPKSSIHIQGAGEWASAP